MTDSIQVSKIIEYDVIVNIGAISVSKIVEYDVLTYSAPISYTPSYARNISQYSFLYAPENYLSKSSSFSYLPVPVPVGYGPRVTQFVAENLVYSSALIRATQIVSENLTVSSPLTRTSQFITEGLVVSDPTSRVCQFISEILSYVSSTVIVSQLTAEILTPYVETQMTATYPELGVGFSVIKRPIWSTGVSTAASGREVRLGFWDFPLWEWELTYEYLPDYPANGFTQSDLKTLMGFFLATRGMLHPFFFKDPDDNTVVNQFIGTTDGNTTLFTLYRTFGLSPNEGTEPIGWLNQSVEFNVYLDGVLQSPSTYSVVSTTPVNQQLRFNTAPSIGQSVSVDMSYYYYVKIPEDRLDFEKFLHMLWNVKKITLGSVRG